MEHLAAPNILYIAFSSDAGVSLYTMTWRLVTNGVIPGFESRLSDHIFYSHSGRGIMKTRIQERLNPQAGIAIGPILFIVAILAILAAAIAAGSGSFTSGTTNEANRTKASAMIQIGENLKVGMDRITMEGGLVPTAVDINAMNTSASNALFAPSGGGVAAPSIGMANNPVTDVWYYVTEPVNGFGTSAPEVLAVLHVASGVCAEINNRAIAQAIEPTSTDLGNFVSTSTSQTQALTNWPTVSNAGISLVSVSTGCVNNANTGSLGDYYYQILAIQ